MIDIDETEASLDDSLESIDLKDSMIDDDGKRTRTMDPTKVSRALTRELVKQKKKKPAKRHFHFGVEMKHSKLECVLDEALFK